MRNSVPWLSILVMASVPFLLVIPGCQRESDTHVERFFAFGTMVEFSLSETDPEKARQGTELIREVLHKWNTAWNPWNAESELADLNRSLRTGKAVTVASELLDMVKFSQRLSGKSDGLFNPALGELIRSWGLHDETRPLREPPDAAVIKSLIDKAPTMDDLVIAEDRLHSTHSALLLDFGAIAKGYAIDRLRPRLATMDLTNYILNIGGDLCATGGRNGRNWIIGIRHPRRPGVLSTLEIIDDECIFTSGDYERFFFHDKKRFHHILDPRDGYPARDTVSVTVVHRSGTLADAAATALFVAGAGQWRRVAEKMGVQLVMLIDSQGRIHLSEALAPRIRFADGHSHRQVVLSGF